MRKVLTVVLVVAASLAAPTMAEGAVKVHAKCGAAPAVKRPSQIAFYCASNGMLGLNLRWRSWGGRKAKAFGTVAWKNCVPDCASGGWSESGGKVTLSRKVRCRKGLWHYSRIRVKAYDGPTRKLGLYTCRGWR